MLQADRRVEMPKGGVTSSHPNALDRAGLSACVISGQTGYIEQYVFDKFVDQDDGGWAYSYSLF